MERLRTKKSPPKVRELEKIAPVDTVREVKHVESPQERGVPEFFNEPVPFPRDPLENNESCPHDLTFVSSENDMSTQSVSSDSDTQPSVTFEKEKIVHDPLNKLGSNESTFHIQKRNKRNHAHLIGYKKNV